MDLAVTLHQATDGKCTVLYCGPDAGAANQIYVECIIPGSVAYVKVCYGQAKIERSKKVRGSAVPPPPSVQAEASTPESPDTRQSVRTKRAGK